MAAKAAGLSADGPDPRLHPDADAGYASTSNIRPHMRKLHDSSVMFEEYHYYAQKTREEEDAAKATEGKTGFLSVIMPTKSDKGVTRVQRQSSGEDSPYGEKRPSVVHKTLNLSKQSNRMEITDEEWTNASRALRTASWGAVFYLITTDILGPFALPYAFASTGYGPGVALFTVFAALAGYSGYLLWEVFMGMDSYEFPLKSFGDVGYRVYGSWIRHLFNLLQGIQLILNVGLLIISNGEALSQATKFNLCFWVCCLIWALVGFAIGQVRTLQKFGWLANIAVWLNVTCMIVTMVAAAHTAPNYLSIPLSAGAGLNGGVSVTPTGPNKDIFPPVQTTGGLPDPSSFIGSLNGAMAAVFSYGGSMIFPEFMSEMKRPRDFLKGMWAAQLFIYFVYMLYGLFIYSYQGQYVVSPAYLGISKYSLQTVGNVFAMIAAIIAAGLYGNIGVKVLYNNIGVDLFRAPPLTTKTGKFIWVALIPIYWAIAFVIAAGIPDFIGLTSVVAAFCILHFTYTFPPLLSVGYLIKKNAMLPGEGFDPTTGRVIRHDSGIKRYVRGFFAKRWYMNIFNIIYMLGALALAGLGAYAAIENLIGAFRVGAANSYTCHSPVDFQG